MKKRVALVTGGTRGLGLAIAARLARDGYAPAVVYHSDRAAADEALRSLRTLAPETLAYAADVGDPDAVDRLVAAVVHDLGPIHALVSCAFRSGRPPVKTHELDPAAWTEDLHTNLSGHFFAARAALPSMVEAQSGRIVLLGSLAARGEPGRVAYATAKAALTGLAGTIAREYARDGITANVVSPGFIEAGAFGRLSPEIRERAVKLVPSRTAGAAEHVAALVAHLCSDAAAYTTAQVIGVDGGAR